MKRSKQDDLRGRQDWKTDETVSENIEKNPFGFFSFLENCDVNSAGLVAASIIFNFEGNLLALFS